MSSEKRLLGRFMDAWERCDFTALASLLREDAILAMPAVPALHPGSPHVPPTWFRGRAAIVDFFSTVPADGHLEQIRLVPVGSNLQPALAAFIEEPDDWGHRFYGVMVFAIDEDAISVITGFADPGLSDYFGLRPPAWWYEPNHYSGRNVFSARSSLSRASGVAWRWLTRRSFTIQNDPLMTRSARKRSTLLVAGEGSAPPLRAVIQRLAELIPTSEVKEIPGASHGMNFQNPVALDAAILAFLEKHPSA